MIKFKTMTREHGDQLQEFQSDEAGIQAANDRFKELTGKGFFAWTPGSETSGPKRQIRAFDPTVEEIVFQPQLKGG